MSFHRMTRIKTGLLTVYDCLVRSARSPLAPPIGAYSLFLIKYNYLESLWIDQMECSEGSCLITDPTFFG